MQVALSGLEHVYISERETRAMCVCSQEFETATGRNPESITCWTLFVPLFLISYFPIYDAKSVIELVFVPK